MSVVQSLHNNTIKQRIAREAAKDLVGVEKIQDHQDLEIEKEDSNTLFMKRDKPFAFIEDDEPTGRALKQFNAHFEDQETRTSSKKIAPFMDEEGVDVSYNDECTTFPVSLTPMKFNTSKTQSNGISFKTMNLIQNIKGKIDLEESACSNKCFKNLGKSETIDRAGSMKKPLKLMSGIFNDTEISSSSPSTPRSAAVELTTNEKKTRKSKAAALVEKIRFHRVIEKKSNVNRDPIIESILSEPTPSLKYSQLCEEDFRLPFPYHFVELIDLQQYIDEALATLRMKDKPSFFENISKTVFQIGKIHLQMDHFLQILYACPQLYSLSWEMNEQLKKHSLVVSFSGLENSGSCRSNAFLSSRKAKLVDKLLSFIFEEHERFLEKIGVEDFSLSISKVWHSGFKLHNIPKLPKSELPPLPTLSKINTISSFLSSSSSSKDSVVVRLMKDSIASKSNRNISSFKGATFEEKLTAKIRLKETEMRNKRAQAERLNRSYACMFDRLIQVCSCVKMYYRSRNVSNMFLVKVVDHIYRSNSLSLQSKDEVLRLIEGVVMLGKGWLTIVENKDGSILRLNKKIDFNVVTQGIKDGTSRDSLSAE